MEKTSEQLRQEISEMSQGLPESDDGYGYVDDDEEFQGVNEVSEEEEEEDQGWEEQDEVMRWHQRKEEEKERRRQEAERRWREREEAALNEFKQQEQMSPDEFQDQLFNYFVEDMAALKDRYGDELVDAFGKDLQIPGRIKLPKGIERFENALEETFLHWVDLPRVSRTLDAEKIRRIIEAATSGPPLRSKARDFLFPHYVKPKPKPKPKAKEQRTFRLPELSTDDVRQAIMDYLDKHPEKWNR